MGLFDAMKTATRSMEGDAVADLWSKQTHDPLCAASLVH
jgi:hypothetical protein